MIKWIGFGLSVLMIVLVLTIALGTLNFFVNCYNDIIAGKQGVGKAIGCIKTEYQRRYDLIPNLCEAVKGYMKHEHKTLEDVILARASATKVAINAKSLTELAQSDGNLGKALARLLVTIEKYPDLKADAHIKRLIDELSKTEDYVAQSRNNYNTVVMKYNTFIQRFPVNMMANHYGFKPYDMFEVINEEAQYAPKIALEDSN